MKSSRRQWFQLASATAAASLAGAPAAHAASSETLPAPIAALKSRRGEVVPITNAERQQRMENAQRLMRENKVDAICMMGGTTLEYFSNVRWWNSERLFYMVLPQRGEPFFVTPSFEEDRTREQLAKGPVGSNAHVMIWHEDESPYEKVAFGLKERGVGTGSLGVEEQTKFAFFDGVAKAAPQVKTVGATAITAGCRMIKSPAEIALMRLAASVTLQAYEAAWKCLKEGMSQHEFAQLVQDAHRQLGFEGSASVQVGEFSALPHGSAKPQIVRQGTILLIDGGCHAEGYSSDISRTFVLGKPTDKMNKVFDIVFQAQSAALKAARPGVACESVDAAARKVVTDAGFGKFDEFFSHRVGHGMGLDGHEWPYLVRGNKLALQPNMTFSDEPGVYIKGEFGVRLEDDMHILEHGAELFTPQSRSLEQPFEKA